MKFIICLFSALCVTVTRANAQTQDTNDLLYLVAQDEARAATQAASVPVAPSVAPAQTGSQSDNDFEHAGPPGQIGNVLNQLIKADSNYAATTNADSFVDELVAINCARCPQDFNDAWKKFRHSVIECHTHNTESATVLALIGLVHTDTKATSAVLAREQDVKAAILELRAVCSQYGIDATHCPSLRP